MHAKVHAQSEMCIRRYIRIEMFRIRSNEIKRINTFLNKIESNQFGTRTGTIRNPDRHSTSRGLPGRRPIGAARWMESNDLLRDLLRAPDGPDRRDARIC